MNLKDLFISKTRVKLLQTILSNPKEIYYIRELVRKVGEQINAVRAELSRMEKVGMVRSEVRANRKYYGFRKDYPFYDELVRLVVKSIGLGGNIIKEKSRLGKIRFAMLTGGFTQKNSVSANDVDLLVVGSVVLPALSQIVQEAESQVGREINYTVMSEEEFAFRKNRRDPFVLDILGKPRVMLIGDEEDFLKT